MSGAWHYREVPVEIILVIGVLAVVGLVWILTNDQRRENEKRRAARKFLKKD